MDKNNFDELLASVQEMDKIINGSKKASRKFDITYLDVKVLREGLVIKNANV